MISSEWTGTMAVCTKESATVGRTTVCPSTESNMETRCPLGKANVGEARVEHLGGLGVGEGELLPTPQEVLNETPMTKARSSFNSKPPRQQRSSMTRV